MIFNSVTYLLFLSIVVVLFYALSRQPRIWLLFLSSLVFYGFWKVEFVSLMLVSAINDFVLSKAIYKSSNQIHKRNYLIASLTVNLGLLFVFKYLYFFTENINEAFSLFGDFYQLPLLDLILPLGISFYTFQTISYTVDVYRGHRPPLQNFGLYGAYVTFFPQLVAGPILRVNEVVDQIDRRPVISSESITIGLRRLLYGLFLKVVLADNIAPYVDEGFAISADQLSALDVWTLAFLFGFQIYFDFSAYSHIAIGSARLMGIEFPENFNFPYMASSFKEFWKRWHISLSSWIRDYLYLPLSGVKVSTSGSLGGFDNTISKNKKNKALIATWAIMGLWHGANWTFVIWGLYHACMILIERTLNRLQYFNRIKKYEIINWGATLLFAMLGWIPFRAQSPGDTITMFSKVINPMDYTFLGLKENIYIITLLILLLHITTYQTSHYLWPKFKEKVILGSAIELIKYCVIIILVFTFLRPITQFIYFQF